MIKSEMVFRVLLCCMLCASWSAYGEPTVGQQFREIMAKTDAKCQKEKLGPYLDTNEPPLSEKRRNGSCEILTIKPADLLATEEGRFAYSIKLPRPYDQLKLEYREGMSAETYFKALCEKEEGDFVFRTVEGVEGIKRARPMPQLTGIPLWQESGGPSVGAFVAPINGLFTYLDAAEFVKDSSGMTHLVHYYVDPNLPANVAPYGKAHFTINRSEARYGYTFRNSPFENREHGIVGQELIVLDLQTNEVLGVRRRFSRLTFMTQNSVQLMSSTPCRLISSHDSDDRWIARILNPIVKIKGETK